MELQFLGHACFLLDDGTYKILTDPFLTGNPLAAASAEDVAADYLLITHGHSDHLGDAVSIARRSDAQVFCTAEMADTVFRPAGIPVQGGNLGGTIPAPFGSVKLVPAQHGSGVPGGLACGFLLKIGGKTIYHAGDTALMSDMALLVEEQIDVALLPIGDFYTMGPADALRAVRMIRPQLTIPMHYDTFPVIAQDPAAFAAAAEAAGFRTRVLHPGEGLSI